MVRANEVVVLIPEDLTGIPVPQAAPKIGEDWVRLTCVACGRNAWASPKANERAREGARTYCLLCLTQGAGD